MYVHLLVLLGRDIPPPHIVVTQYSIAPSVRPSKRANGELATTEWTARARRGEQEDETRVLWQAAEASYEKSNLKESENCLQETDEFPYNA